MTRSTASTGTRDAARGTRNGVFLLSAARTPIGKLMGGLAELPATQLGSIAIRAAIDRAGLEPSVIDEVIMGQVIQAGAGQAPARQASIAAGVPTSAPAPTPHQA